MLRLHQKIKRGTKMTDKEKEKFAKWCKYINKKTINNPLGEMSRLLKENIITEKDIPEFLEMVSEINRIRINIRYLEELLNIAKFVVDF